MSLKTLDHFTFFFFFNNRNERQKKTMLDAVRSFISTLDSFNDGKVTIKSTRISIEHRDYYFAFDSRGRFNIGFTCGEGTIAFLNGVMNEVCKKFSEKIGDEGKKEIDIVSSADYVLNEKCNLFAKLILTENLRKISYQNGMVVPTAMNLSCRGRDSDNSAKIMFSKENEKNKLEVVLFKDRNNHLIIDAAKEAAEVIHEMANRVTRELISES